MDNKHRGRRLNGAIRKLPSGRYQARFRAPDGTLRPAPDTFRTKAEANTWLASVATDMARDTWIDPDAGRIAFRKYAATWMETKTDLAPKTVELYSYLLEHLLLPTFGDRPLRAITPVKVREWRAALLRGERPGPSTIAKAYRLLSQILKTAQIDRLITDNPCVVKGAGVERAHEIRAATPSEVSSLADLITPRYRALVLTAAYAGCRWGELAALRRRNLDLDGGTLRVMEQTVELHAGARITCGPKTDAGRRVVHLPTALIEALRDHLDRYCDAGADSLVFTSSSGTALRQGNFRRRHWLPAVRAAGLDGLRFHDLRHTAGTLATISGATIREVQARLGHASPAAAYRYQHVLENRDAEIARQLDAFIRPVVDSGQPSPSPQMTKLTAVLEPAGAQGGSPGGQRAG